MTEKQKEKILKELKLCKLDSRDYNKYRKDLIKKLKSLKLYDEVDDILIDGLVYSIKIADMSFFDIEERGVVANVSATSTVLQRNHSVSIFFDAMKQINELSKKLGLSTRDRVDIGVEKEDEDDF